MRNIVSFTRATYEDLYPALRKAIESTGGMAIQSGDTIAVKINLCDARSPQTGAITHPVFLDALLKYLREAYENLEIYVVESDATVVLADEFIRWFGFEQVIEKWNAKWCNLSKEPIVEKQVNGYHLKKVPVPELLTRAQLISLSKLKTNSLSRITCALKNQFGCLPMVQKSVFHDHLHKVIADVNLAIRPCFSIVDGILGIGGPKGPTFGIPVKAEIILAGRDPVAVDAACSQLMGIRPRSVRHIRLAQKAGIGSIEYTKVGDDFEPIDFGKDRLFDLQLSFAKNIKKLQLKSFRKRKAYV